MTQPTTPQNEMTARIMLNKIETQLNNFKHVYEGVPVEMRHKLIEQISHMNTNLAKWTEEAKKGLN